MHPAAVEKWRAQTEQSGIADGAALCGQDRACVVIEHGLGFVNHKGDGRGRAFVATQGG